MSKEIDAPGSSPAETVTYHPVLSPARPGRYLQKEYLAKGGMGEVWVAQDTDMGRDVALKRIRQDRRDLKERFLGEAQVTGQLEHPGIVPVYDLGSDVDGQPFYIMKRVRGGTLKEVIADYHRPGAARKESREVQMLRLLESFVSLCQTVAYAHSRGVIHRDLKPDNVMVGAYGETIVLDWGLAKLRGQPPGDGAGSYVHTSYSGSSMPTEFGKALGTPPYMPPEVAGGKGAEADERTDVYLLGATLYSILTNRPPHLGASRNEIIELARTTPPVPPRQLNPQAPRALEAIRLRAMADRKEDRYPSAQDLAKDVQRYLAGEPVSVLAESLPARAWRWAKKHRQAVARTAAAVLVGGVILAALIVVRNVQQERHEFRQEAARVAEREKARGDLKEFRRLSGEGHYYAANTDAMEERAPYYDHKKGEKSLQAALAITQTWGASLEQFPLRDERPLVEKELYATQRYYDRLKGKGKAPQGPGNATTLDHFLLGEEVRKGTASVKGSVEVQKELLVKAIDHFRQALALEPDHYWSRFQLGRCYLGLGQTAEAVEALGGCVAIKPEVPWAYSARGLALAQLERFDEAERDLDKALELDEDFQPARLNRGVLRRLRGNYHKARDDHDAVKKDYDMAQVDFDAVLEAPKGQRLIEAAYYRGIIHLEQKDYPEAVKDFFLVTDEKPDFRLVYLLRARAYFLQNEDERGLDDLNNYLAQEREFDRDGAEGHEKRGRLLRHMVLNQELPGRMDLVLKQLKQAEKLGRNTPKFFSELGEVLDTLGQGQQAITYYDKALKGDGGNPRLLVARGWAYAQHLQKLDEAEKDFAQATKVDPAHPEAARKRPEAHAGLGYVYSQRKAVAEAEREAARSLLLGAGDYTNLHNVACIYAELALIEKKRAVELEDLSLVLLRRDVELWKEKGRTGPDPIQLIQREAEGGSFRSLKLRPEFQKLIKDGR